MYIYIYLSIYLSVYTISSSKIWSAHSQQTGFKLCVNMNTSDLSYNFGNFTAFSCIFIYFHAFSCIFMYIHEFSCIFMYIHEFSCIFMNFNAMFFTSITIENKILRNAPHLFMYLIVIRYIWCNPKGFVGEIHFTLFNIL